MHSASHPPPSPAPSPQVTGAALVPMAAPVPPVGSPAHSSLTRLLQQSSPPPNPLPESVPYDDMLDGHDTTGLSRTGSVLRRRVSTSCSTQGTASRRNTLDLQLNCDDTDTKVDIVDDDVSTSTPIMSMPVPRPGASSTAHHHHHLRPPTPDHFIAVTPPSPPRSRPHRPSPSMLAAPATDDSIVAHALLSRATSLPHPRAPRHVSTSPPTPPMATSPSPPSPAYPSNMGDDDNHNAHSSSSRVSCWSSGTAPHLSRAGASVPSAELSSKDHMALAGWSWESSSQSASASASAGEPSVSVGAANAYPTPPTVDDKQVRLPLTLEDLASGRPVVGGRAAHERRHESAPTAPGAAAASGGRPFSVWGVR